MLPVDDYSEALEIITGLMPDFVHAALSAKVAPNTPEAKEYEQKAAYILAMSDTIKSMNAMRHNLLMAQKPRPDFRPAYSKPMNAYHAAPRKFNPAPHDETNP